MRVATYSRVSTSHHDQRPEIQVDEIRRYCQARGWIIAHEIVDHGFSGGTDNRPGLKKLMSLARAGELDVVIVLKLDRLFRSLKHLVTTLEEFETMNLKFIAIKDGVDYTSATGRLFAQILGSLAEFEKSLLRDRTIMGLNYARSIGKQLGRPRAHNYSRIRELRQRGLSYAAIQKELGISKSAVHRALAVPKSPS